MLEHLESLDGHAIAVGHGRSMNIQYRPRQTPAEHWTEFLIRHIIFPLRIFPFLIIYWAGLNVAGPGYLLLFWNLTESTVRGASPYSGSWVCQLCIRSWGYPWSADFRTIL